MTRLAVVMVALIGCTKAVPPVARDPEVAPAASAPPVVVSSPPVVASSPPPLVAPPRSPLSDLIDVDGPDPAIGAACTNPPACGKSGKISLIATRGHDFAKDPPCKPVEVNANVDSRFKRNHTSACVAGDRVFVSSGCFKCRLVTNYAMIGRVSDMTPTQLARLQGLAEVHGPVLTTVADWSNMIADAKRAPRDAGPRILER